MISANKTEGKQATEKMQLEILEMSQGGRAHSWHDKCRQTERQQATDKRPLVILEMSQGGEAHSWHDKCKKKRKTLDYPVIDWEAVKNTERTQEPTQHIIVTLTAIMFRLLSIYYIIY